MTWKPGESGNPGGRGKDKPLTDAIRLEAAALANNDRTLPRRGTLRWNARQLLTSGSTASIALIWDRLEGRVPQGIGQDPTLAPLQLVVTGVPRAQDVIEDVVSKAIDITPPTTTDETDGA